VSDFDPKTTCGKPCDCESYRAHIMTVSVSAAATPTRDRSKQAADTNARESRWEKDMPAYKRLREDGLQPPHIDGAARVEATAGDKLEVEAGRTYGKQALSALKEIKTIQRESA
jgi:hypothetical protein